jgi:hypothetical protein
MLKLKEQTEIYRFIKLSLPGGDKKTIFGKIITRILPVKNDNTSYLKAMQ